MTIRPKVLSHYTPKTNSAPLIKSMNRSIWNSYWPQNKDTLQHMVGHWNFSPFPTKTLKEWTTSVVKPNYLATLSYRKLWVLLLSIKMATGLVRIWPMTRRVCGIEWPIRAWRLIWVGYGSDPSIRCESWGISQSFLGGVSMVFSIPSSSTIKRWNIWRQWWPVWKRSSKL